MQTRQLSDRLTMLLFPVGQAYLWRDPDGVTLVDTGVVGAGPAVETAIRDLGLAPADVDQVVITHFHDDHAGAAAELAEWPGVTVLAHRADAPVIRGQVPGPPPALTDEEAVLHAQITAGGVLPPAPPARVDRELDDGDVLDVGGGAQVIAVPGHTDGSMALFLPAHGVLFTGDVVARHQGRVLLGPFNLDRRAASASFRRLAELDSRMALFGHGEPVTRDARAALAAALPTLPYGS